MKTLFIIGGMGAGKSLVRKTLSQQGVGSIDLDAVGHEILHWDTVKADLVMVFGEDILGEDGEIRRHALAAKAFVGDHQTHMLNCITLPRIEEAFRDHAAQLEREGYEMAVVEYSAFKNRSLSLACDADLIIAVLAPEEVRVARAVEAGWIEADVRRRIARQITDEARAEAADVVFVNDSAPENLQSQIIAWWTEYSNKQS